MEKNREQWYVVKHKSNKYDAIIFDDLKQCKNFAKSKGVLYKGFVDKEDAIQFAGCKKTKISWRLKPVKPTKICLCCEKPFKGKTKLCPTCNKLKGNLSVRAVTAIKYLYPNQSVFKTLSENPNVIYEVYRKFSTQERADLRREKTMEYQSDKYLGEKYKKDETIIPDYIQLLFDKDKTKELLYLEGDKLNPKIYYICKRCEKEQCQTYENMKVGKGHNCDAEKSSGEVIVEEYLKKQEIKYKTQYETLVCINPKTKRVLPYDFEIRDKKIIIEVQGEQHTTYAPYFHGSVENLEYQVWKDGYKKQFAESKGYTVLEIFYTDFDSGAYIAKLDAVLADSV